MNSCIKNKKNQLYKLQYKLLSLKTIENIYYSNTPNGMNDYTNLGVDLDRKVYLSKIMYSVAEIKGKACYIEKESYTIKNKIYINIILEVLFDLKKDGKSDKTISNNARVSIMFIQYCIKNNYRIENSVEIAKKAYITYTTLLNHRYRIEGSLAADTIFSYQLSSRILIAKLHSLDTQQIIYWATELSISKNGDGAFENNDDKAIDADEVIKDLNVYYKYFNHVYDLIVQKKIFPYKFVLPTKEWYSFPIYGYMHGKDNNKIRHIDKDNGLIKSFEEIEFLCTSNVSKRNQKISIKKTIDSIIFNNLNYVTAERMQIAQKGIDAFFILFLAVTGMNEAQALNLTWDQNTFDINTENAKFKTIKYRAGGKSVKFQIRSSFMKEFKKFLELRTYRLNKTKCNLLFFRNKKMKEHLTNKFISGKVTQVIVRQFSDNGFIPKRSVQICAQVIRNFKSREIIKKRGILLAAEALQHTPKTNANSYGKVSVEEAQNQIHSYLNGMHEVIINNSLPEIQETEAGNCKNSNNPEPIHKDFSKLAACLPNGEGCLFCKHYKIHANEQDIHKILSLKYILDKTRGLADSKNHFESEIGIYIKRIENLCEEISNKDSTLKAIVEKIEKEVYTYEILTEWYQKRLRYLYEIGAI